uniref:Uncharacterized protein n=1 Tax=Arundo donax TaxID=35708 RepID=A0A0A8Z6S8_ARUDO
MELKEWKKGNP